jgi:hypothetical protein
MNVEQIQKINNLALELMKSGMAESRDDAIEQARKILDKDHVTKEDNVEVNSIGVAVNKDEPKKELSKNEIEEILSKNTQYVVRTLKEFQQRIEDMEGKLSLLKSQVNTQRTVREIVRTPQEQNVEQKSEPVDKDAPKPRYGDYTPKDVSIEKYFYCGNN